MKAAAMIIGGPQVGSTWGVIPEVRNPVAGQVAGTVAPADGKRRTVVGVNIEPKACCRVALGAIEALGWGSENGIEEPLAHAEGESIVLGGLGR